LYLTRQEEAMLRGDMGEAVAEAMRLIVRVGEALGAERLVEISHAHASGISYDNIGEPGLEYIRGLAERGGRVVVYATYNPVGMSLLDEQPVKLTRDYVEKQLEILRSLEAMGFRRSVTCIPYAMRRPRLGEHLAWGESSAVAVANTLYGARTNREGGPVALAAALTGRTYLWGLHLDEERRPKVYVRLEAPGSLREPWAGVLGHLLGRVYGGDVAYVDAAVEAPRGVQALCAAAAASGSTPMCIVRGVSPEDRGPPREPLDRLGLSWGDLVREARDIASAEPGEAEVFFTGCPHHGPEVLEELERLLDRAGARRLRRPIWVAVPGYAALEPRVRELAARLRARNVHVFPGTCPVVTRLRGAVKVVATDSVKTAFYLPRRHGVDVALASVEDFVRLNAEH